MINSHIDFCPVGNIWERQELLSRTIGPTPEEKISFDNSILLFYSVIALFIVLSILELVTFLAYEYWVLGEDF